MDVPVRGDRRPVGGVSGGKKAYGQRPTSCWSSQRGGGGEHRRRSPSQSPRRGGNQGMTYRTS